MSLSRELIAASGYDRTGFASRYDRFRPRTPRALVDLLCRYALAGRPALVVDLGCGTGLSTRVWSDVAERVVGVEPNGAMLAAVERLLRPVPGGRPPLARGGKRRTGQRVGAKLRPSGVGQVGRRAGARAAHRRAGRSRAPCARRPDGSVSLRLPRADRNRLERN